MSPAAPTEPASSLVIAQAGSRLGAYNRGCMAELEAAPTTTEEQESAIQAPSMSKFCNQSQNQADADTEDQTNESEEEPEPDPDGDFAAGRYRRYESSEEFLAALMALT